MTLVTGKTFLVVLSLGEENPTFVGDRREASRTCRYSGGHFLYFTELR